jgi:SAM-dependent methyltransferase
MVTSRYQSLTRRVHATLAPFAARLLRQSGVIANPFLSAKFLPLARRRLNNNHTFVAVELDPPTKETNGLPTPPTELQEGWGSNAAYLSTGKRDTETMLAILQEARPERLDRILDFGCGAGRMLRFLPEPETRECWGVDIKAAHIQWCQQHLSPPFFFATTTTFPHLPFEDDTFDLVYCGSVFTHIAELADAWLLELRRITRPHGLIYVTIHDEHSIEILLERYPQRGISRLLEQVNRETGQADRPYFFFATGIEPWTQIFYNSRPLVERWRRFADVVSVHPEAMDYQTALLLRKRDRPANP